MKYSGAEIIIKLLERQGIETIAGIPGGCNLPLYDALYYSSIRHILARHEQGAGFIAQGIARTSGQAAVCLGTSGPGATNLITAIADAKADSIPLITITGQVPSSMIGTDAFQEVDMYGLCLPITKHTFLVQSAEELIHVIPQAFHIAESGRPGPVVIDVPKDVQKEIIELDEWPDPLFPEVDEALDLEKIEQIKELIHQAKRPMLYIGGGIISANASETLRKLAWKNGIPVTSTLMGLGAFPNDDPLFLGMLGMHGARYTNLLLEETDLLLAFGVRFDDRAVGKAQEFCSNATIVHIDIDHSEIDKIKTAKIGMTADIGEALKALEPRVQETTRSLWRARVAQLKIMHPYMMPDPNNQQHPVNLLEFVSHQVSSETVVTTDVGQHQMWTAQVYPFQHPRTFLTSGGLGTMGFGLPAAIGAALANPEKKVICISGDGSMLMNIQELATLAEHQLNVTVLVMNNNHLGMVRQQQELFFDERTFASKFVDYPNFAMISQGFGVSGIDANLENDPFDTIAQALEKSGPCVVNVPIDWNANVYPMVPPGAANREMIGGESYA